MALKSFDGLREVRVEWLECHVAEKLQSRLDTYKYSSDSESWLSGATLHAHLSAVGREVYIFDDRNPRYRCRSVLILG